MIILWSSNDGGIRHQQKRFFAKESSFSVCPLVDFSYLRLISSVSVWDAHFSKLNLIPNGHFGRFHLISSRFAVSAHVSRRISSIPRRFVNGHTAHLIDILASPQPHTNWPLLLLDFYPTAASRPAANRLIYNLSNRTHCSGQNKIDTTQPPTCNANALALPHMS